ncbi:leucine--tRNA ligase [Mesonia aestuariivivens]|uniref:Leucine--tRNA ligase n=1 Tax=Mesonia aestuariivivens TaxID=2796128 RepID=A0ABS6VZZ2_9FLAO|nr:class I tRNA ligase family protein [Mesonia aestuariivivens]MBW2960463.1 leucine--tRNA ligase [Mesonia aestuariivivens]
MSYNFNEIEAKWQKHWAEHQTFKATNHSDKEKFYVLDMFPYPSGAGLHVGHPLGYIASDIYARYKRHQGFNVLHPQGYDSFGLPAEQYAIQTGQHPADTTKVNIQGGIDKSGNKIAGYRNQLDKIGFSFDWSREVRTSDPNYYKWTQWIFIQLFESWYDVAEGKARPIAELRAIFATEGNSQINAACDEDVTEFSTEDWNAFSEKEQEEILLKYRLTYLAETEVNWCPQLGTVLANDEIVNGVSERGGYPVVRKKMKQWSMRISAYAERLLQGLNDIDWTESLKESQRNWIGKSVGASVTFKVNDHQDTIEVFTTRPDTIFGVTFMTLAPEHELVSEITTPVQKEAVEAYVEATAKRSERERMADVKTISGVFTGAYAEHPFTKEPVPIWIGDYVLASYGTGAVMAVPCGDQRDFDFAKHFEGKPGMPKIKNIFKDVDITEAAHADKEGTVIANSDFLNDLSYKKALKRAVVELEKMGQGNGKTNYRLRDAVFSRQRYWGEPFPVYYVNGMPKMIDTAHLPIQLPEVEKYLPTEEGEPPLGRADVWAWDTQKNQVVSNDLIDDKTVFPLELNTMPGWAGSSWYFFRYMEDEKRDEVFASPEALNYWQNVDLYIGGSEHATGHLLYARFWTKFLKDRGFAPVEEPFKKLINQGMILGESSIPPRAIFRLVSNLDGLKDLPDDYYEVKADLVENSKSVFISADLLKKGTRFIQDSLNSLDVIKSITQEFVHIIKNSLKLEIDEESVYAQYTGYSNPRINLEFLVGVTDELNIQKLKNSGDVELKDAIYLDINGQPITSEDQKFLSLREVEKMSKRWGNVVNPDDICVDYGADTLRMYEMFLGPLEQAKPWNTAGITGVHNFLKKLWKLYHNDEAFAVTNAEPSKDSLKTLHKTIKKVIEDIENFSFNTSVSTFMICVNELTSQKCTSKAILEPLAVLISPYAPHIAEELWSKLGNEGSVAFAAYPKFEEKHLKESSKTYPVSFNGKMRFTMDLSLDLSKDELEEIVMNDERTKKQLDGATPKKVIIVPGKIINIVK